MITLTALVSLLFSLVIVGLICWVLFWAIGAVGLPEPFNKITRVVIIIFAAWFVIGLLLPLTRLR